MVAGMFESLAVLVIVSEFSGRIVRLIWAGSVGALLTSLTTTVKELVAKNCFVLKAAALLSITTVVKVLVLGPCASVGVQVMTPAPEMLAFVTWMPAALVTNRL